MRVQLPSHVPTVLLLLQYRGIPNSSPLFQGLAHDFAMEFGMFHLMCHLDSFDRITSLLNRAFDNYDLQKVAPTPAKAPVGQTKALALEKARVVEKKTEKKAFTLVQFKAVFKSFGVSFPKQNGMMMEVFMRESAFDVNMTDSSYLRVQGKLGAMTVDYNNDAVKKLYPHIMNIDGENLIHFTLDYQLGAGLTLPLSPDAAPGTVPFNAVIKLNMSSVQFNYVQVFIEDVVAYFLPPPELGQKAVTNKALTVRAEQLQKATVVAANETNFGFEVTINNPIVFLPRSLNSPEGLKADLGKIRLSNHLLMATSDSNIQLVRETMRIEVSECTLLSCVLGSTANDQAILQNTDLRLEVIQTKKDTDRAFPGMEVTMNIPSIGLQLSEYQLKLLRSILEDNCSLGVVRKPSDVPNGAVEAKRSSNLIDAEAFLREGDPEEEAKTILESRISTDIRVAIQVEAIQAELLKGDGYDALAQLSPLGETPKPLNRDVSRTSLLSSDLRSLNIAVEMKSDASMNVELSIQDLFVRDARVIDNPSKFRDIFTTRLKKQLLMAKPYFQLTYIQESNNSQDITINIYRPAVICVPDIWIDLLIFMLPFNELLLGSINAFTLFWADFSPKLSPGQSPAEKKPTKVTPPIAALEIVSLLD